MRITLWALLSLLFACGRSRDDSAGAVADSGFIALNKDFADYETWQKYEISDGFVSASHLSGPRTVFINKVPPSGSTTFAQGTIIVKQTRAGDKPDWDVHAMVKRGGSFNAEGAAGWEWFDLHHNPDGVPLIRWQGEAAPAGENYASGSGAVSAGDCNGCHKSAKANDFVQSAVLQLSGF